MTEGKENDTENLPVDVTERRTRNGKTRSYGSTYDVFDYPQRAGEHKPLRRRFCLPCIPDEIWTEVKAISNLSYSNVLISMAFTLNSPVSLAFTGRLGTAYLDAVGLGNTMFNISCYTVAHGIASACDTVFSQSYGSSNKKMVGVYLQRSMYVCMLSSIPSIALQLNMESILRLLGQKAEIANLTAEYLINLIPAIPAFFFYVILGKYLRNQNILLPVAICGLTGVGVSALFHHIFINILGLGIIGSAYAQCIGYYTTPILLVIYVLVSKCYRETWDGFSLDGLQGWGIFGQIAIAGLLANCFQWWGFEIGTILAGLIGDVQLGVQSILFQVETFGFMIPISVSLSGNIRIGQHLGAMRPDLAKKVVYATFGFVWCIGAIIVVILLSFKDFIPMLFSTDEQVTAAAAQVIPILALYHIFDGTSSACLGIMRGCGYQKRAAIIVFLSTYLVGLPIGIPLMLLTDLRSAGYWWGLVVAIGIETIAMVTVIAKTDWTKEAQLAQIRANVKMPTRQGSTLSIYEKCTGSDTESYVEDTDETKNILDDDDVIIPKAQPYERKYCGEYVSSQIDMRTASSLVAKNLTISELLFWRTLTAFLALLVLGFGIFCSFSFHFPASNVMKDICVYNVTGMDVVGSNVTIHNVTYPLCNVTTI